MKNKKYLIAPAIAVLALLCLAADSFWGSKTIVATMHGETNYLAAILGDHTASGYRKISPSNLVDVLYANGNFKVPTNSGVTLTIANGGAAITSGQYDTVRLPNSFTVAGWTITGEPSGSIVARIEYDSYANFPPDSSDEISGTEDPTLSTAIKNEDNSLSTWTDVTLSAGDFIRYQVTSATTVTNVKIYIYGPAQ